MKIGEATSSVVLPNVNGWCFFYWGEGGRRELTDIIFPCWDSFWLKKEKEEEKKKKKERQKLNGLRGEVGRKSELKRNPGAEEEG